MLVSLTTRDNNTLTRPAPDLAANCPPFTVNTYVCLHRWRGRGWSTPELTSDCPLQLDTVRSLISQSSLRTLV